METGSGIILRARPLKDTSLIVHWLTAEHGRLSTVALAARRPKSTFFGKLDLFYEANLSFKRNTRSELHGLREVVLTSTHTELRTDYLRLSQAAYAVSFVELMTELDTPIPEIHELFVGFIRFLESDAPRPRNIFAFELKFLSTLGLEPLLDDRDPSVELRELGEALIVSDWKDLPSLKATATVARELQRFLHGFIIFHCGKLPHGRAEALEPGTPAQPKRAISKEASPQDPTTGKTTANPPAPLN